MKYLWMIAVLSIAGMYVASTAMAADSTASAKPSPATHRAASAVEDAGGPEDAEEMAANQMPQARAPDIDIAKLRDPFESYLTVLAEQNKKRMDQLRNKIAAHAHEPLESFDLSALTLVATMQMGGRHVAMVQDPQGKGYMVREGSYIGRDNGRVVKIGDRNVEILEDELTPTGELVKRKVTLTLNEVNQ